ncbi:MAG: SDR family oxidoreductase [Bacteroidota bacterium]
MKNLKDKVVVITGAASGIGRALAKAFAKENCQLVLNDYDEKRLSQTASELQAITSQKIMTAVFDVAQKENFDALARRVATELGRVDVVINNAGVALGRVSVEAMTYEDMEWVMNINFWGMVYGTKSFLTLLKKQSEAALVNISSVFGLVGIGHQSAYCSSKFAIRGFTESLRMEAKMDFPHVTIHTVHPGGIQTNIAKNSRWVESENSKAEKEMTVEKFEKMFITTADAAAAKILKCVKKKKSKIVIGKDGWQLDWLVRLMPEGYTGILVRELERRDLLE